MKYCPECGKALEQPAQLNQAVADLVGLTIERVPDQFSPENDMYEEGDEKAPFFSEAYLYNLLGKDDARSVLRAVRELLSAAGVPDARRLL